MLGYSFILLMDCSINYSAMLFKKFFTKRFIQNFPPVSNLFQNSYHLKIKSILQKNYSKPVDKVELNAYIFINVNGNIFYIYIYKIYIKLTWSVRTSFSAKSEGS